MNIKVTPRNTLTALLSIVFCLFIAHMVGVFYKIIFEQDELLSVFKMFDFGSERNVPTLYASMTLLLSSLLLMLIAHTHKKAQERYLLWALLSLVFLFLSMDELFSFHERLTSPSRNLFEAKGVFYYAWIIPYGLALLAFCALYFRFLFQLPRKSMYLFVVSGALFVTGAIGFEMLGGMLEESGNRSTIIYALAQTAEELFEKLGIALFIYSLLDYLVNQYDEFKLELVNK
ncbi:hypothetical protein [Vibrio europaeus]|uniref:hypothetical protein n=1 Tax=Vibrio europaeus TaxID=300876 RepID=UPI0039E18EF7